MSRSNAATIDIEFLTGQHHKLAGLSEIDQRRYLSLWGLCARLERELLPEVYNGDNLTALKKTLCWQTRACSAHDSLRNLAQRSIIVLPIIHQCRRIAVVGLKHRYPTRTIEVFDPAPWFGSDWIRLDRIDADAAQKTAPPPSPVLDLPVSNFHEIYATMRGINARVYRDLVQNSQFDEVLATETARLGSDRVQAEAKRFALHLEGGFQTGEEKREKRHRPYKRFADWLNRSKPGDTGNGYNGGLDEFGHRRTESYIDRCLREAREGKTSVG